MYLFIYLSIYNYLLIYTSYMGQMALRMDGRFHSFIHSFTPTILHRTSGIEDGWIDGLIDLD